MEIKEIIEKMETRRDEKVSESYIYTRGNYTRHDMSVLSVLADGYSMAVRDLKNLVESVVPPCTGSSVQKKDKHNIEPIEVKPKYEEKKCKVDYIRADGYPTTEVKFVEEIQKVLVGAEEVSNLDIVSKINEIIKVVNGDN